LQTCGVLINYDMPWNPMRAEQRIGRIDRIGQQYREVWISNYFYQDTIEDVIYQRLSDRINWFEVVVGDLQPILAEVGETTRRLAMLPAGQRKAQLETEVAALRQRLQNREMESLNLDEYTQTEDGIPASASPVKLEDLQHLLTQSNMTAGLFRPHPNIPDAYLLTWKGERLPVTFSPTCFDAHPDTVRFMSYGSPLLADILESIPCPEPDSTCHVIRLSAQSGELNQCAWFISSEDGADIVPVIDVTQLKEWLEGRAWDEQAVISDELLAQAEQDFSLNVRQFEARQEEIIQQRRKALILAKKARAQRVLVKAALVELALGQQGTLWDTESYPSVFTEAAITGLKRHGYPWTALLRLALEPGLLPESDDLYYQQISGSSRESLRGRFAQLTEEAGRVVASLSAALQGTNS